MSTRFAPLAALWFAVGAACAQTAPEVAAKPASGPASGAHYAVDPSHTFVIYEIGHYGTSTNRGRFSTKDGSIQIDAGGRGGHLDITMDIESINTGVQLLNRHLMSKDFFNAAEFPTARFVSDQIVFAGERVQEIRGSLTLLGRSHPLLLTAKRFGCYMSPLLDRQVCGGDFEAMLQRSQWGINWGLTFGFEDKVRLLVQVEAVRIQ